MRPGDQTADVSRAALTGSILVLALLGAIFLAGTVPYLADSPLMTADQTRIAAPAWKLASTGV